MPTAPGAIPSFEKDGLLPPGVWECTEREFIARFCSGQYRGQFTFAVKDLLDFSARKGATRVFVGGTFVTNEEKPRDFDCVVVFQEENQIPERSERYTIEGTNLDIFFCAETQKEILDSFVALFGQTRRERKVGVVQISSAAMDQRREYWHELGVPMPEVLRFAMHMYTNRHIADQNSRKALLTIHGIKSYGEWNAEVTHVASSSGWIVAPFTYGDVGIRALASEGARRKIVDDFRAHINDIFDRYDCHISIVAHSFGSYIAARYFLGFDQPPILADTLILAGSIIDENLDFGRLEGKVFKVINEVAPNDAVVKYAKAASLWSDPLIGRSGEIGFQTTSELLDQHFSDIFTHNNVIRRDVVSKRWMPWLESNVGRADNRAARLRKYLEKHPEFAELFEGPDKT